MKVDLIARVEAVRDGGKVSGVKLLEGNELELAETAGIAEAAARSFNYQRGDKLSTTGR